MEEVINMLLEKLKGLRWFIISGFAVEIYTHGKRKSGDIDLAVHEEDLEEFSKRVGTNIKERNFKKEGYSVQDLAIEFKKNGKEIEVTGGYPRKRVIEGTFNKLFNKKIKMRYENCDLWVCPIEELMVLKASLGREKDFNDLELLKDLTYRPELIKEIAKDCGVEEKVLDILKKLNYMKI